MMAAYLLRRVAYGFVTVLGVLFLPFAAALYRAKQPVYESGLPPIS